MIPDHSRDLFCPPYSINLEMASPRRAMFGALRLYQDLLLDGISLNHQHRTQAPGLSLLCHLRSNQDLSKWDFCLHLAIRHFQQTTESAAKASLRRSSTTIFWIFRRQKHRFLFKRLAQSRTVKGQLPVSWLLQQSFHQCDFPVKIQKTYL